MSYISSDDVGNVSKINLALLAVNMCSSEKPK